MPVYPCSPRRFSHFSTALLCVVTAVLSAWAHESPAHTSRSAERSWLAGDHHIHSHHSVGYDRTVEPPKLIRGGDGIYSLGTNARMARRYGLAWMVGTDHGGPNHAKYNLEQTYPELVQARLDVPEVIQFYGMEFDTPGADHSSLIIAHTHDEADRLHELESRFAKREPFPADPTRDTEPFMLEALTHMRDMAHPPVLIANHPSRSARGPAVWGQDTPAELRGWNDTAPGVSVGMEGAPGHQAAALNADDTLRNNPRGGYRFYPTHGGFDQMTSILGGFWDSMLGEGRRWWVTSTSDSHRNWREGGTDFWPGEYAKTYVHAAKTHDDILDGLRSGRVFVTTGDLISELYVSATTRNASGHAHAEIGGTLERSPSDGAVEISIRFRPPTLPNGRGQLPVVARVDLIVGTITGPAADRASAVNPTTRVEKRFTASDWRQDEHGFVHMQHTLTDLPDNAYVRIRGTNTTELEPQIDVAGEDPWQDLWFYSNPLFIQRR